MKKLSIIVCLFYFLSGNMNGQVKPLTLSAADEREAKNLAISFFNRFRETQDLAPLVKEYFVKDFARRLKFCDTTGDCGGSFRDFWGRTKEFTALDATETDSYRFYVSMINYDFLYFRSVLQYLNDNYPQRMSEDDLKTAAKSIENELKSLLKDDPGFIKFNFFGSSFNVFGNSDEEEDLKLKSLAKLRQFLNDSEKVVAALRVVETKLRNDFRKENPDAKIFFSHTDFRVGVREHYNRFFDYPVGTKMLEVWGGSDSVYFTMNFINEDGKLKIVGIYPPLD